ncbi:TPA_asm: phage tail tape measure protein [Salmonella enterica subsp. enterica serovar Mbandaka]|uniref:Phage tail tape measure protein n=1 Tax=Salmonella enterica subsp. enterica serovar Mbandaka TaxID=192954 RepID=A0A6X9AVC3_SALET|nr:phage tail tape measure protein [Salmonella enterica]EDU3897707.1 phage tail tape measure protein [Salmonella enterica subsp. enterica serovar Mbandaka]EGX8131413.1 phage tail tape measure protein [Salmonella enterica subsp. enterica serovar Mbandaka]EIF3929848.1 phage tail tape measure protein [Salmonella enterica subsp. enterica serovar Mbandaka]HAB2399845.1 phage tail tape measure protein [Salmonella enterica subsp. enterica serovar Mbandaka]HAB5400970.1 phage tail tape measure protein [
MATLRELIIKISANSQSFQSEISRASRMGQDYYRTMQNGGRQAAAASRETQRALADLTGQLNSAKASAVGLAGAFAGAYATGHLISLADEWSSVNARLKQASQSTDDFNESQRALMEISQRTGTAFSDNASLFARSAASMREYGYSSEEVLKVTEAISTGLKLSGASSSEASSVITQFSQALAQGVLRGEEFNSVNENGDRVIRALASGMGVARKDLKAMADQGQLTADKVVPALISQLGALQDEYSAMPQTVASATTKIENAFLAWVGGANEATGATSALTGALNAISDNINTVASAAGVLAAIGGSRFIGGMIGDLGSQTAQLVEARKNEIALAAARASTATQSQRKAAADAIAAERAYQLAQSELVLAKNTNAEATATQNAISKRRAMITANAALVQSNRAVAASQQALNSATSVLGLVKTGATGLLGLVGGLPGLLMLGAGAWYTMYQNQEQARRSAQEYAGQIDEIRQKTSKMSLTETDENRGQTVEALVEQNRLVDEQAKKVGELKDQIDDLNASRGKPGITSENDANILKAIAIVTDQLAVEEGKLNDMRDKSRGIQQALEEIERRRNDLIREQAWRQNAVYQSMIMMNGQHTEFNRLLGLGNQLLMARQGLANVPLRLPQADLDKKQTDALEKSRRDLELSRRKGEAKERLRLSYAADDLGLTSDPQFQTGRQEFINNGLAEWRNNEANKPKAKGGKTEGEKTEDVYKRLIKQQKEQIALQGQNTELAKVKYQVSQGELATLTESQKQTLLQNAALIDQQKIREQLRNYEANLADSNASSRAANEAQLIGYGQGSRFRERLQEQFNIRKEFEEKNTDLLRQRQTGEIDEAFYQEALALNKRYLDERLRDQQGFYAASDAQRSDWTAGMREGFANWADTASDYASQSADLVNNAMTGLVGNISDALSGNKVDWEDWASSVLQSMQKIILNAMIVNSLQSSMGSGGFFSGLFGSSAGGSTPSGAYNSAASGLQLNAKGGAYASASLSAYSNSIVSSPTYFAFAKGAGLMGEAGPEAIMPLTRSADGSLGVRVVGSQSPAAGNGITQHITQHFTISGNGDAALKQAMQEAARQGANDGAKQARQDLLQDFSNRGQARRLLGV